MSDETPDQVTLDDLVPVGHYETFAGLPMVMCRRCFTVVPEPYDSSHERWHTAIEEAADPRLSTLRRAELDRLVKTVTADPVNYFRNLGFSVADAEQAGAVASARPEEFQPLRDQLIEQLRNTNFAPNAQHTIDQLLPVVEAWAEKYLHRATTAEALAEQLRAQLEQEIGHLDRCNERHAGLSQGETDRLRRVEDALVAAGAPNHSERGDPGGLQVAWIQAQAAELDVYRRAAGEPVSPSVAGLIDAQHVQLLRLAAQGRRAYAETAPDEQAKHLSHEYRIFDAAARLIEDPRRLAGLIPTSMQTWSLDDDVAEIVAKATGIRVVLLDPTPEHVCTWTTDQVNARVDERRAGIITLLELAARGREAYAQTASPTRKMQLRHEAKALQDAIALVRDPGHLEKLCPASMLAEGQDAEADPQRNAEVLTDQMLTDMLCLVGVTPTPAQLAAWTPEQREQAAKWAGAVHLDASDNDVDVPERPAFLNEPAAVPCQSKFLYQPDGEPERLLWCGKTVPHDEDHYHFLSPGHGVRWTSANQAGLIHLGDSDAEPCPSLYLHNGTLVSCKATWEHDRHQNSPTGNGDVVWFDHQAVSVPWPLDQEPPAGIDVLEDIRLMSLPGEQFRYLCRVGLDRWSWEVERRAFTTNEIDYAHSSTWTEAIDNAGYLPEPLELHVVRP